MNIMNSMEMNSTLAIPFMGTSTEGETLFVTALSLIGQVKQRNKEFSPVTLSPEWSRMSRLLLLSCLAIIGSIGNVFMISSLMIEDYLKKAGNAFLGNIALADMLITSFLIPASTIVLLADVKDLTPVCRVQWFFASCAFLVSIMSLGVTAIENYNRLCTPQDGRPWFNRRRTTAILLMIWMVCSFATAMQYAFEMEFDYCMKNTNDLLPNQAIYIAAIIFVPIVIIFYTHIKIIIDVRRFMSSPNFKPSATYSRDIQLAKTNFYSYIIFVIFWLPFGIVLAYGTVGQISSKMFYNTAWLGFSKSCFHNVIYCLINSHFRNAYMRLFNYCCCKTTVSVSRRQRADGCRPSADVRVHIIPGYNMYSYTSPQRSGNNHHHFWSKREMHEL